MHVQTTPVGKKASKKNSTTNTKPKRSNSNICLRVKGLCPEAKDNNVNDCISTVEDFTNFFQSLLQNKTRRNFKCREDEEMKCKEMYCVYCTVDGKLESKIKNKRKSKAKRPSVPISTIISQHS
jgi:hypothetical protein